MSAPRILIVDDEADIRGTLREILADEGMDVDVAADAVQARAARARREPDLVLLDIWMPDTDGITLLREWSQQGGLSCPVVMMSGHGTVETAVEATRLGAFDFVEKPLSLTKLLRVVEKALESGRRKRTVARARRLQRFMYKGMQSVEKGKDQGTVSKVPLLGHVPISGHRQQQLRALRQRVPRAGQRL